MLTQERASRAGEQAVPTLNLTPMIDVVFQLIIFFMCAMRFKTLEKKIEMSIPKTDGMRPDLTMPQDDPVKVRVSLRQTETEGIPRLLLLGEAMRPELGRGLHRLASLPKDAPEGRREADNARRKQRWERHFQPKLDALEARLEHIASVEPGARFEVDAGPKVLHAYVVGVLDTFLKAGIDKVDIRGTPPPR
jgi:biopolymer transport protein ExbD